MIINDDIDEAAITIPEWDDGDVDLSQLPDDEPMEPADQSPRLVGFASVPTSAHVLIHGRRACGCMARVIPLVEEGLRSIGAIKKDLSGLITQQAYSTSVGASAGTHDGGGVWDVVSTLVDTDAKQLVWMQNGILPGWRLPVDAPRSKWPAHGHMVTAGCPHLTPVAARQIVAARKGLNGLANGGPFRGPDPSKNLVTWQAAYLRGRSAGTARTAKVIDPIAAARKYTPKPWPILRVDGVLGPDTIKRLQMQLQVAPTGKFDHYTVRALALWLRQPDPSPAVISTLTVTALQSRVKAGRDGRWGPSTTRALQQFLNANR